MPRYHFNGSDSVTLLDKKSVEQPDPEFVGRFRRCLRVDAELCGSGSKPWAWAIYTSNPWLAFERSEAMFRTSEAAKRVGALVAAQLDPGSKPRRSDLH
jgi:hypothetical protein